MRFNLLPAIEKVLVLLIVLTLLVPLGLAGWQRVTHDESIKTRWLRNASLAGTAYAFEHVPLTAKKIFAGKYQRAFASNYDHSYMAREVVIRYINEIYVRAFGVSTLVQIGRGSSLFLDGDLKEYALDRLTESDEPILRRQVADIKRFQDFCEARKTPFCLMITPNKAAIYPEQMPLRWQRRFKPGLRRYDRFIPLLQEMGVHYADGHRVTDEAKPAAQAPLFPTGGIHWGDRASFATANEVLRVLGSQGLGVQPINEFTSKVTSLPRDRADRDLTFLLNSITEPYYPVEEISPVPREMKDTYRPNVAVIGGSFDFKLLQMLDRTGQFSELDFYFYYTVAKDCQVDGELHELARPTPKVDFNTEIFAADAIIFEANEGVLYDGNHLSRFLRDAFAAMPDPHTPKAPFKYTGSVKYAWGDTISVTSGPGGLNPSTLVGFTPPGEAGTFTEGPVATMRLKTEPAPGNIVLGMDGVAILDAKHLPEQRAEVFVNDHRVGEWIWTIGSPTHHELTVPKAYLPGGALRLEFRIAKPLSPIELGTGKDDRKLSILVSKIRLREAGKP